MSTVSVHVEGELADMLQQLAAAQQRSEAEIVREALEAYMKPRPLPKGVGKYRSGQQDTSEQAKQILRDAERRAG
jgi:hypothetical protein